MEHMNNMELCNREPSGNGSGTQFLCPGMGKQNLIDLNVFTVLNLIDRKANTGCISAFIKTY